MRWCAQLLAPSYRHGFPGGSVIKNPSANSGDTGHVGLWSLGLEDPWSRKWQPTPVFLPGKCHEQRRLADCSPRGHRVGCDWAQHIQQIFLTSLCFLLFFLSKHSERLLSCFIFSSSCLFPRRSSLNSITFRVSQWCLKWLLQLNFLHHLMIVFS